MVLDFINNSRQLTIADEGKLWLTWAAGHAARDDFFLAGGRSSLFARYSCPSSDSSAAVLRGIILFGEMEAQVSWVPGQNQTDGETGPGKCRHSTMERSRRWQELKGGYSDDVA